MIYERGQTPANGTSSIPPLMAIRKTTTKKKKEKKDERKKKKKKKVKENKTTPLLAHFSFLSCFIHQNINAGNYVEPKHTYISRARWGGMERARGIPVRTSTKNFGQHNFCLFFFCLSFGWLQRNEVYASLTRTKKKQEKKKSEIEFYFC